MGRLFGTDGARGIANTQLTCELAMQIGRASVIVLTRHNNSNPKIIIGKDTRISSEILECALVAGVCSVGANVELLGVIPTPAVSFLVGKYKADAGIMISASHNPVEYNGIKLFNADGYKLSDQIEQEIETLILDKPEMIKLKDGIELGRVTLRVEAKSDYINHIMSTIDDNLAGITVAVDCANGSASSTAKKLFLGLDTTPLLLNHNPDGTNINQNSGSTNIECLSDFVVKNKCDIGVAFDGDADRCLAVDENGEVIDGDKMIAIFADQMRKNDQLKNNTAVVTVMSNLGFFHFAKNNGINVATTKVGDRYVLEKMLEKGYNLGGEQSGHIIFSDYALTGDGQLSAVQLLNIMKKSGKKASELSNIMTQYPQVLINIKLKENGKELFEKDEEIKQQIINYQDVLGQKGRILVRASGTEPLIRIMVEGQNFDQINQLAKIIGKLIEKKVGLNENC